MIPSDEELRELSRKSVADIVCGKETCKPYLWAKEITAQFGYLRQVRDQAYRAGQIDALKQLIEYECHSCKIGRPIKIDPIPGTVYHLSPDGQWGEWCDAGYHHREIARLESENK